MNLRDVLSIDDYKNLETIAYKKSKSFCYGCYIRVEQTHCPECHSDDLAREIPGVGLEFGLDWVIEHLIAENCAPVDPEFAEESLRDCYEETVKVGWIDVDPIDAIKVLDPISYRIAIDEYIDGLKCDEEIIEVGNEDYWKDDILKFIEDNIVFEDAA